MMLPRMFGHIHVKWRTELKYFSVLVIRMNMILNIHAVGPCDNLCMHGYSVHGAR